MSGAARQRVRALSEQLSNGIPDAGKFEDIPRIRHVASDSTGQKCKGKVVLITGCNSPMGIGRASAHQFARNGVRALFLCDFAATHLPTHKREIEQLYPSVEVHVRQFDAGHEPAVQAAIEEVLKLYGRLDVVFANAGVSLTMATITEASAEAFMEVQRINALSVFLAAKHGARAMMVTSAEKPYPGGSIIGTASVAGLRSNAGATDYSASKAAVISIMQTAAYQLAGTGIRCNAICPGLVETGMTAPVFEMARARGTERKVGQLNPLQRGAVADEIARVALFLGSDEASYVNGQAWAVDGGLSAGHPFVPGKLA